MSGGLYACLRDHFFRCSIPGYENDTYKSQGDEHDALIRKYIPMSSEDPELYDSCKVYKNIAENVSAIFQRYVVFFLVNLLNVKEL